MGSRHNTKRRRVAGKTPAAPRWELRLYIAGQTPKSLRALSNLKQICSAHLADTHTLEIIDLLKQPNLAQDDQIIAIPTLVRKQPLPVRKIVGDLSNTERVLAALGLDVSARI